MSSMQPAKMDPSIAQSLAKKGAPEIPVQKFEYQGRVVYEWEQTLDEVKVTKDEIFCCDNHNTSCNRLDVFSFFVGLHTSAARSDAKDDRH